MPPAGPGAQLPEQGRHVGARGALARARPLKFLEENVNVSGLVPRTKHLHSKALASTETNCRRRLGAVSTLPTSPRDSFTGKKAEQKIVT